MNTDGFDTNVMETVQAKGGLCYVNEGHCDLQVKCLLQVFGDLEHIKKLFPLDLLIRSAYVLLWFKIKQVVR